VTGWRDMELGAPEVARLGMARLNSARAAMLGTLRRDGSPRISPIEPYLGGGRLLIGAMAWPAKAGDLRRDPRYVLHSVVTGPDCGEGELKLYGSAVEAGQDLRGAAARAWWLAWPPGKAIVFSLRIGQAVFIDWDTGDGLMTVHQWSPAQFPRPDGAPDRSARHRASCRDRLRSEPLAGSRWLDAQAAEAVVRLGCLRTGPHGIGSVASVSFAHETAVLTLAAASCSRALAGRVWLGWQIRRAP
jgi:Pyridoxamine 5'-phosphate oxidase